MSDPDLARPWGTGSIERRNGRYIARWRTAGGQQRAKMFDTPELASEHLGEVYGGGRGNRPVPIGELRALTAAWLRAAAEAEAQAIGPGGYLVGNAIAQAIRACASDLEGVTGVHPRQQA